MILVQGIPEEKVIWLWKNIGKIDRIFTELEDYFPRKYLDEFITLKIKYLTIILEMVKNGGIYDPNSRKVLVHHSTLNAFFPMLIR